MKVRILKSAPPGGDTVASVGDDVWEAKWQGENPAYAGSVYDVEIEIDELAEWIDPLPDERHGVGVWSTSGVTTVCGNVETVYDDGLFALRIGSGTTLIDPGESERHTRVGEFICFTTTSISIFPSGI